MGPTVGDGFALVVATLHDEGGVALVQIVVGQVAIAVAAVAVPVVVVVAPTVAVAATVVGAAVVAECLLDDASDVGGGNSVGGCWCWCRCRLLLGLLVAQMV